MAQIQVKRTAKWADVEEFHDILKRNLEPVISITSGTSIKAVVINFRAGFMAKASEYLNDKTHVIFAYSRTHNAIIFEFTNDLNRRGAYRLGIKRSYATVSITSFVHKYRLEKKSVLGLYSPILEQVNEDEEASWVIYLDERVIT